MKRFISDFSNMAFVFIIIINTIFFSGYYILKDPLAFILHSEGLPLARAYSITTTANILLSLCSLFFGFTLHNSASQKFCIFIGMLMSVIAIVLLEIKNYSLTIFAITFYVVGGGLYFFNIVILINRLFTNSQIRIRGNYIYQIFVNIGGLFGCFLFLIQLNNNNIFKYCKITSIISLLLFIIFYKNITDSSNTPLNCKKFTFSMVSLFIIVFIALKLEILTRISVMIFFCSALFYVIKKAREERNKNMFLFLSLVLIFNIPYWIANTIIFNEFIFFLRRDVSPMGGIPSTSLIMIDPLINALLGGVMLFLTKKKSFDYFHILSIIPILLIISFVIISLGLFLDKSDLRLNFLYPLFTMIFFASAEFLLQTTLNSKIKDLLINKGEFIATGIMRSSRAFATVIGYCLIIVNSSENSPLHTELRLNFTLYMTLLVIGVVCFLSFYFLKKKFLVTNEKAS